MRTAVAPPATTSSRAKGGPRAQSRALIRDNRPVRRGLAALLFFIAAVCLAVAAGGWWLQRVAFDPDTSGDVVEAAMDDSELRGELARLLANSSAATVGVPPLELRMQIESVLQFDDPAVRASLGTLIADSHARLIGLRDEPVQVTGQQLVPLVRNERAAELPAVTLPVEEVTALNVIRIGLDWFVPIAAIAGGIALLLGLLAHPRRADAVYGIGMFCLFAAGAALVLGFLLPTFLAPELSDDLWLDLLPAAAKAALPLVVVTAVGLVAAALALVMLSAAIDRRRRSWDKPVAAHQADQRRWS
jgi:hypothetical protein